MNPVESSEFRNRSKLPHIWWPRSYQRKMFEAWELGIRRFMCVWPRRGGKDSCALNFTIPRMFERVGTYVHLFPELAMGRRIIWDEKTSGGKTPEGNFVQGFAYLEHFPRDILFSHNRKGAMNEAEMTVQLQNTSLYRIAGADMPDRLRGMNPVGINFSECALMTVRPWRIVEPILVANDGWATFNTTPQGLDWFTRLWESTKDDPSWFHSIQTNDTVRRDGILFGYNTLTGKYDPYPENGAQLYQPEEIDAMRRRGVEEEWIQQELFCSFVGAKAGAYYGRQIADARREGRIGVFRYDPRFLVQTVWDLGVADLTAIWFFQNVGNSIRCVDYYENSGRGLEHYIGILKSKPYVYSGHWAPHDIQARELSSGKTRLEIARGMGIFFRIVPQMGFQDGINAARAILPRCEFDVENCDGGLQALENYRSEYSDKLEVHKTNPVHNRWSHGADAFRYLAIVADLENDIAQRGPVVSVTDFDPINS